MLVVVFVYIGVVLVKPLLEHSFTKHAFMTSPPVPPGLSPCLPHKLLAINCFGGAAFHSTCHEPLQSVLIQ